MNNQKSHSAWILNLFSVKGIPLRIHFTFFLLLAWVGFEAQQAGESALLEIAFVLSIFVCVLLHELGHALTAKRYGIRTRDIVLYPFGGVAMLNHEPRAWAELVIALAGPAVNLLIALLILPFVPVDFINLKLPITGTLTQAFLGNLLLSNIFLLVFNMIPALPMDGGRVLRATLAILKVKQATVIAGRLSQLISAVMGLYAIYSGNPVLMIISALVFTSAFKEVFHFKAKNTFQAQRAADFMIAADKIHSLVHGTTLSEALRVSLRSLQSSFPVIYAGEVIGMVGKEDLLNAASQGDEQYISGLMSRDFPACFLNATLSEVLAKLEHAIYPLVVSDAGQFRGMIIKDKLTELLMLEGLRDSIGRIDEHEAD